MGVTREGIAKGMKQFEIEKDGMTFLRGDAVDEASKFVLTKYVNEYSTVEENENGRDKFVVGNAVSHVKKPLYERYILE